MRTEEQRDSRGSESTKRRVGLSEFHFSCVFSLSRLIGFVGSTAAPPVPHLSVADLAYTPESTVDVSSSPASVAESWEGDMLLLMAFQQEDKEALAALAGAAAVAADERLGGAAQDLIVTQEFKV